MCFLNLIDISGHVTTLVGGVVEDNKTSDQAGAIYNTYF